MTLESNSTTHTKKVDVIETHLASGFRVITNPSMLPNCVMNHIQTGRP